MFTADNYSLAALNAFRFDHSAKHYVECNDSTELLAYAQDRELNPDTTPCPIIFGDGTNTVLTRDIAETVLRFTGAKVSIDSTDGGDAATVTVEAGKNWHEFVIEMTNKGFRGIENLSLIPGTCGAAPVQNIGAYGVELSDTLSSVTALHWPSRTLRQLTSEKCKFAYRDSLFKRSSGEYIITDITLKLQKNTPLQTSYGAIQQLLDQRKVTNPTEQDISAIVCEIRQAKLPDPMMLPNAGSYFKNPVVTSETFNKLIAEYPDLPSYPVSEKHVKIAAGWLIDTAGLKGYIHALGNVGVHDKQALVLVRHGGGDAKELMELAQHVVNTVSSTFNVELEREPVLR